MTDMSGSLRRIPRAAVAAVLAAGLLAACGGHAATASLVSVTTAACGSRWSLTAPGWHTFQIRDASSEAAEVDLINPATGAIYAEVEALGPDTTRPMPVNVGAGAYAFRCLLEDTDPITGPTVRVGGHARGAAAILPVTTDDLLQPAK